MTFVQYDSMCSIQFRKASQINVFQNSVKEEAEVLKSGFSSIYVVCSSDGVEVSHRFSDLLEQVSGVIRGIFSADLQISMMCL